MAHKNETIDFFIKFYKKVQNNTSIRTDHRGEFNCKPFKIFCDKNSLDTSFLAFRIPQQNRIVERKNRVFQEMRKIILCEYNLSKYFWAEAVNTSCYIFI